VAALGTILASVVVALANWLAQRHDLRARVLAKVEAQGSRREAQALAWLVESAARRAGATLRVRDVGDAPRLVAPPDGPCPVCGTQPGQLRAA